MPLYFDQLEQTGDRFSKDSGKFLYGAYGEGLSASSRGWRIETSGEDTSEYRVLRPRVALPVGDSQRYSMQARVLSNVSTTQDFRGIGLQARAFNSSDSDAVTEVWRNEIDTNPDLWLREVDPARWRYLTAVDRIPKSSGAEWFVPELLVIGEVGGWAQVSMFAARTANASIITHLNAGPDNRHIDGTSFGIFTVFEQENIDISRGQDYHINVEANVTVDDDINQFGIRWNLVTRDTQQQYEYINLTSPWQTVVANKPYDLKGERMLNATADYEYFRVELVATATNQLLDHNFEIKDLRIDFREQDLIKTGA